jgi:hypothetical protein
MARGDTQRIYFEKVEALSDLPKTKAFAQVAEEMKVSKGAVQGGYYAYQRSQGAKANGRTTAPRRGRPPKSASAAAGSDALIASAKESIVRAIEQLDADVRAAESEAETAQQRYESLRDSVEQRRADLTASLERLGASA